MRRFELHVNDETMSEISEDQSSSEWQPEMKVCVIDVELLQRISKTAASRFSEVTSLDLHLKEGGLGKIRIIENLHLISNLQVLNLSYNAISMIEGLESLTRLVELNLAENAITKVHVSSQSGTQTHNTIRWRISFISLIWNA